MRLFVYPNTKQTESMARALKCEVFYTKTHIIVASEEDLGKEHEAKKLEPEEPKSFWQNFKEGFKG